MKLPDDEDGKKLFNYLRMNSYRSECFKLFYVATPKVACTSFKWWFADLEGCAQALREIADSAETDPELVVHDSFHIIAPNVTGLRPDALLEPLTSEAYFRFAIVRNPYKRIFSAWQSKLLLREPLQATPYLKCGFFEQPIGKIDDIDTAFEGFLEHLAANEAPHYWDVHWTPQTMLLRPDLIRYSHLVKLEQPQKLRIALSEWLGPQSIDPFAIRRTNESLIPYLPEHITKRSSELIRKLYADDFEMFGYSTKPPEDKRIFTTAQFELALRAISMIRGRHQRFGDVRSYFFQQVNNQKEVLTKQNAQIASLNQSVVVLDGQIINLNQAIAEHHAQIVGLKQAAAEREAQIVKLNQAMADRDAQIASLTKARAALDRKVAELNQIMAERDGQIVSLNRTTAEQDEQIVSLNRTTAEQDEQIVSLKQTADEREGQIVNLKQAVVERDGQIVKLNQVGGEREAQIASLTKAAAELDGKVSDLSRIVAERDGQIVNLNQAVAERNSELDAARNELHSIYTSKKWKIIAKIGRLIPKWKKWSAHFTKPLLLWPIKKPLTFCRPQSDADYIERSGLFDAEWYLAQYPDVAEAKVEPLWHYLNCGAGEGRDPGPNFCTEWYLWQHRNILTAGINPLVHYVRYGKKAGLKISGTSLPFASTKAKRQAFFCSAISYLPGISIIIPTYNGGRVFKGVLDAIDKQEFSGARELLVIDSSSEDGTDQLAECYGAKVKRISKRDFNHSRTRQWALSFACYDRIVFLVQDATPLDKNLLKMLYKNLDKNVVGAYGRAMPYEDADLYARFESESHREYLGVLPRIQSFPLRRQKSSYQEALYESRFDNVCSIYWRKALDRTPFPDTPYAEDMAWARAVMRKGMKIRYSPEIQIQHSHNRLPSYRFKRTIVDIVISAQILNQLERDLRPAGAAEIKALEELSARQLDVTLCKFDSSNFKPRSKVFAKMADDEILARSLEHLRGLLSHVFSTMQCHSNHVLRQIAQRYPHATDAEFRACIPQILAVSHGLIIGQIYASYLLRGNVPTDLEELVRPLMGGI